MAARQVRSLAQTLRLSSPHTQCVTSRVSHPNASRGFASEHHGPPKVNFWEDPMSPSKWKEEHFVLISLAGWGALIYGSYKFFTGGKKDKSNEVLLR
ncbi:uncharacterized protein LOC131048455 isoform X2 [Cryptomeria japonica]|uniref:uncharacterized protein LOC131048455 isoform X2 n=1 Tax=Cryptomeria japonica TaxID=3369 RepID=UPI0025AD2E8B|nr:uncharacterized protein LOC131048455 isoform X2 [Cryptomeria japonica]